MAKSITKGQLLDQIQLFTYDREIWISVGSESYPIDCVITGAGKIYLEANQIITPKKMGAKRKYETEEARLAARRESNNRANAKRRAK